jgi:hypothetical protein
VACFPGNTSQQQQQHTHEQKEQATMTTKQVIFDATIGMATDQVMATPGVDDAWRKFRWALQAIDGILTEGGKRALALDLEETVNAYAGELVRAAFLEGLAFDGRALLLQAANE